MAGRASASSSTNCRQAPTDGSFEDGGEEDSWVNIDSEEALEAVYALAPALSAAVGSGASPDSPIFHALARLVGLLVTDGEADGYTPFAPAGDVLDIDGPDATENASAEAAAAAAAAATMAAAAQRALGESMGRLRALCAEAAAASAEAEAQRERARSAGARHDVLSDHLEAINGSIGELRAEEAGVAAATEARRAEALADEAALSVQERDVVAEREAASRVLRSAMERAAAARARACSVREGPMLMDEEWESSVRAAEAEAEAATEALAAVQAVESARETARTGRLRAAQRAAASTHQLRRIEAEAAAARLEGLSYRRAGLEAEAEALRGQLCQLGPELAAARPAAVVTATRAERLATTLGEAQAAVAAERRGVRELVARATAAAEQSLRAMAAQDAEAGAALAYDEFGAGGGVGGEHGEREGGSLAAARAEARRWRERAEELEFLKDVVVVQTAAVSGGSVGGVCVQPDSCQNGMPAGAAWGGGAGGGRGGAGAGLDSARRAWMSATAHLARRVHEGRLDAAHMRAVLNVLRAASAVDATTGRRPAASMGAGAAIVGGGIGLAALGPVCGTALAGAAGAIAYTAASRGEAAAVAVGPAGARRVVILRGEAMGEGEGEEEGVTVDVPGGAVMVCGGSRSVAASPGDLPQAEWAPSALGGSLVAQAHVRGAEHDAEGAAQGAAQSALGGAGVNDAPAVRVEPPCPPQPQCAVRRVAESDLPGSTLEQSCQVATGRERPDERGSPARPTPERRSVEPSPQRNLLPRGVLSARASSESVRTSSGSPADGSAPASPALSSPRRTSRFPRSLVCGASPMRSGRWGDDQVPCRPDPPSALPPPPRPRDTLQLQIRLVPSPITSELGSDVGYVSEVEGGSPPTSQVASSQVASSQVASSHLGSVALSQFGSGSELGSVSEVGSAPPDITLEAVLHFF
jgi:hypothetical protein